ncbi:sigma-70 family RNA polymerase sigma factor [Paenibacillus yanchengensis]|uniref:sigma-70 family RNA polymerase sigma factor n=1 Tax=Paenibacillus yanchengensis TaxID=2035833 RepID=UPI003631BCBC
MVYRIRFILAKYIVGKVITCFFSSCYNCNKRLDRRSNSMSLKYVHPADVNDITLIDILGTDTDEVADKVQLEIEKSKIYKNLSILDDREKEVVINRFGLISGGEERTQREIAKELGISRSYVSRIEKRALMKLYHEHYKKR